MGPNVSLDDLSAASAVVARQDVAACALGEGTALLDLNSGIYYTLNPVAAHIWAEIERPKSIAAIAASVAARFETGGADCSADVRALLERLLALGLVERACAEVA